MPPTKQPIRSEVFAIRMSPQDMADLNAKAEKAGMTPAVLIRFLINSFKGIQVHNK